MLVDFSKALIWLKEERRIARKEWKKGTWIVMQTPNNHSKMTERYLYIESYEDYSFLKKQEARRMPWQPSQSDLMAEDWYEVGE